MVLIPEETINQVRDAAMIVEVISDYLPLHKQGASYQGLCPFHGEKTPSFNVNPARNSFHCFGCGCGGNPITFVEKIEGLSFPAAVRKLAARYGITINNEKPARQNHAATATVPQPRPSNLEPRHSEVRTPAETWQTAARKLVETCHARLLTYQPGLDYLAARGLDLAAVVKYRLGWLEKEGKLNCIFRPRAAWGLPEQLNDQDKPKKLWIPRGIVIPSFAGERIDRIRIRRPNKDLAAERVKNPAKEPAKYIAIEGGGNQTITSNPQAPAQIAIESDLDALLIDHLAGDLVGVIPLTTVSVMPNGIAAESCARAAVILVALDFDTPKIVAGKMQRAGEIAWRTKWQANYPQAIRWPVPAGKDPGEAYEKGVDLRAWVLAGLPVSLHPAPRENPKPEIIAKETPMRLIEGREVWFPSLPAEWRRLVGEGKIVMGPKEARIMAGSKYPLPPAGLLLDVKEVFPGAYLAAIGSAPGV